MDARVLLSSLMQTRLTMVGPGKSIRAVATLMKDRDIGFLPVVEGERAIGVVFPFRAGLALSQR
ncbi:CBS domain-containing protein [Oceaniovalibus sp. ACAM 378]|uniref:CBS domain-containing protein n=1 Tax=Oceaniovalibus sp. ACAM 378 TaxID=2599923 RepID=UPI0011D5D621|nr:CBS domain-containing protein [Oceaniovalibus sp. ACAM 378]